MEKKVIIKSKNHTALPLYLHYIILVTYSYKNVFNLLQNIPYRYVTHSPVWSTVDQHLLTYLANTFEVTVWLMYKHKYRLAINLKPGKVCHLGKITIIIYYVLSVTSSYCSLFFFFFLFSLPLIVTLHLS